MFLFAAPAGVRALSHRRPRRQRRGRGRDAARERVGERVEAETQHLQVRARGETAAVVVAAASAAARRARRASRLRALPPLALQLGKLLVRNVRPVRRGVLPRPQRIRRRRRPRRRRPRGLAHARQHLNRPRRALRAAAPSASRAHRRRRRAQRLASLRAMHRVRRPRARGGDRGDERAVAERRARVAVARGEDAERRGERLGRTLRRSDECRGRTAPAASGANAAQAAYASNNNAVVRSRDRSTPPLDPASFTHIAAADSRPVNASSVGKTAAAAAARSPSITSLRRAGCIDSLPL
eukprot:29982-Pelagococcus_subviridis.AAC.6